MIFELIHQEPHQQIIFIHARVAGGAGCTGGLLILPQQRVDRVHSGGIPLERRAAVDLLLERHEIQSGIGLFDLAHFLGKMERKLATQRLLLPNERDRCVDIRLVVSQDIQQVRQIFVQHHIVALIEHAVLIGVFPNVVENALIEDAVLLLAGDVLAHQQEELIHGGRVALQQGADRVLVLHGGGALEQVAQNEGILLHRPIDGLQRVKLGGAEILQAETQPCDLGSLGDRTGGRATGGRTGSRAAARRGGQDHRAGGRTGGSGNARRTRCTGGTRRRRARRAGRTAAGEHTQNEIRGNGYAVALHHVGVAFHLLDGRLVNARGAQQRDHFLDHFAVDHGVAVRNAGEQLIEGIAALGGRFFRTAVRGIIRCAFLRARHRGLLPRFLVQRSDHFVRGVGFLRADGQVGNGVEGHEGHVAQRHEEISGVLLALEGDLRRKTQLGRAQSGHR